VLAGFLAARTTTLRLGMGVSLLPLHHPIDLAEQLAVLDVGSAAAARGGHRPRRHAAGLPDVPLRARGRALRVEKASR